MLALDGLVVLDFCHGYPGSYSTMFLGDFGARVIRVDAPGTPDRSGVELEKSAAYKTVHRNKKSIIINMKHDEGQAIVWKLAKKADILVEGFRPGVMARLKADYDYLKKINPRLIYCSVSGFGQDGPYASLPSHDMNYIGIGGALSLVGPRQGPPYLPSNFVADMGGAGLHATLGILIALAAREKTGKGQFVDISYLDSVISLLATEAPNYFEKGKVPRRGETMNTGGSPWGNVYRCKDGEYIVLGCMEPHFWKTLCQVIGKERLIPHQNPPLDQLDKVMSELGKVFVTKTRDEWFEFFKDKNTCVSPVYYLNETFSDPQVLHRKMVVEVEHPRIGKVKQIGIPIKLSDTPGSIRELGTPEGTHTDEILRDLAYSAKEIERLRSLKVIG